MIQRVGDSINELYISLTKLFQAGKASVSIGSQQGCINELLDVELILRNPRKSVLSVPYRNMSRKYASGEFALFMGQYRNVEEYAFYAPRWRDLADPDGIISSAYGWRMFSPRILFPNTAISRFDYALNELLKNRETKNAVITMRDDSDMTKGLKDRCCTMYCQFYIRDNKLNMLTVMRSSDFWFGLPYDVFWYTKVMQRMAFQYNAHHPDAPVTLGTYTHRCTNLHVYAKEWDKVNYADLPAHHDPSKDYEFPEWEASTEIELPVWLSWERYYRTSEDSLSVKAARLRDYKFHPFLETMGSLLVNKIKTRLPTEADVQGMYVALHVAEHSRCIDRKVGCAIRSTTGEWVSSCNEVLECNQQCADKEHRVCVVTHAEVGALERCKQLGLVPEIAYVSLYPCLPCRTALEEAGIKEVVVLGFSHKGAVYPCTIIDPAFVELED